MRPRDVVQAYDTVAATYRQRFADELEAKPADRALLRSFAQRVGAGRLVADIGCGPAQIGAYLRQHGLNVVGIDISVRMLDEARILDPAIMPVAASYFDLPLRRGSLDGAVAFYSLIHAPRASVGQALEEIRRACAPGARFIMSAHRGSGEVHHDEFLGHGVHVGATLFEPSELATMLRYAGWMIESVITREPYAGEGSDRLYATATA